MLHNLYAHNDWANAKIMTLCDGLSDAQLDAELPMGFGSLRATVYHMWAAERLWLDRWLGKPWEPLRTDSEGISVSDLAGRLASVAAERNDLVATEAASNFERIVQYKNTQGDEFSHRLGDLMLHVANHAVHHRAQALHYLKHCERTVPAGLDYIFYKLAHPTVVQDPAAIEGFRSYGLDVAIGDGLNVRFNRSDIQQYYAYSDWATDQILEAAANSSDAELDRDFGMGPGTFRRTALHILFAAEWWLRSWTIGQTELENVDQSISLRTVDDRFAALREQRNGIVAELTPESAARAVTVKAGGPPSSFQVIESMIQMCAHGTHHRAQLVNMLRQLGLDPPAVDHVVWLRIRTADSK